MRRRAAAVVVTVLLLIALAGWLLLRPAAAVSTILAAGTVEARESDLGFRPAGRIELVAVDEGEVVAAGDLLAALDDTELEAGLAVARAQAAAARATLDELTRGFRTEEIEEARAAMRAASRRLDDARRDLERARNLFSDGAISQQALDDRETALTLADAEAEGAGERLRLLESGIRSERVAAQRATLSAAEAEVERVAALLAYSRITAPFAGVITIRHREPGEVVAAGAPVLTLMNPGDRWVRIYVRADRIGRLSIGQVARITADAYPDRSYTGRVAFIASEAEFTPRDVQTAEERVKLVYRVKVKVEGDPDLDLKPGLAADVRFDTDER